MHGSRGHWGEAGILGAIFGLAFAASRTFRFIIFLIITIFCGWWMWTWLHSYTLPKTDYNWESQLTQKDEWSDTYNPVFDIKGKFRNLSDNFVEKGSLITDLYTCPTEESGTDECSIVAHDVKRMGMRVRPGGSYVYNTTVQFEGVDLAQISAPRAIAHWSSVEGSTIDYDED